MRKLTAIFTAAALLLLALAFSAGAAQHDYIISNADGATVRADINAVLQAIVSNNANSTEPATTYAYQWWLCTANGTLQIRNAANTGWVAFANATTGQPFLNLASNATQGITTLAPNGNQTSATAATTPEWAFHTDKKYHYFATRDMSLTNATFKVQTNFFPQFVSLHVWDESDVPRSWGFFDRFGYGVNAASFGVQKSGAGAGANTASDTYAYRLRLFDSGTSVTWHLSVSTWDSDGVTFQWGKYQGEPAGTAYCSIVIE